MGRFEGVIFDMDGTLVEPLLDFGAIREELGIRPEEGILEAIEAMDPPRRDEANMRLGAHELSAARRAPAMPGAAEVVGRIRRAGLPVALLTRNTREAMATVVARLGVEFDLAWSREDGPIKPEPDGVLRACEALGIAPRHTACVGDFHYDIIAANAAGAVSVLLCGGGRPAFADEADHVIEALTELPEILGIYSN